MLLPGTIFLNVGNGGVFLLKTGLIYDPAYLNHNTGGHPESGNRVAYAYSILNETGMLEKLVAIKPRPASMEEIGLVHLLEYITRVRDFSNRGGGSFGPDNVGSSGTFDTALLAAGGTLSAVDAVMARKVESAFALVRPPGHHARPGAAMGFCFFNNVAICARYAAQKYGLSRILVVDWDVHHGNGTEEIFYNDSSVLYFSVHHDWSFPGTGHADRVGEGKGKGYNINVPLPRRSGDDDYEYVFRQILQPVAYEYNPELVLVSAGMDTHAKDPIGQMNVTGAGYSKMTEIVLEIAGRCCGGSSVFVLEGGYNLKALAEGVLSVVHTMNGWNFTGDDLKDPDLLVKIAVKSTVVGVKRALEPYWPVL
jgi:acetoin utilization deacetylase AcuC-like enzyme